MRLTAGHPLVRVRLILSLVASPVLSVFLTALPVSAQAVRQGRIEGVVFDSLKRAPLAGAVITVMQLSPEPQQYFTASTDAAGRYHVDSLAAGRFTVGFNTGLLDSLDLQLPQKEMTLGATEVAHADFATPSRATLTAAACPGLALPRGHGALLGQVLDADTEMPLARTTIVVSWVNIGIDRKTVRPISEQRVASITTDSLGLFRACGVPTDTYITLQIQQGGKTGAQVRAAVGDEPGVMLQHLSFSASAGAAAASRIASSDSSTSSAPTTAARDSIPLLTGTSAVAGLVRGLDGQPIAGAQLRVLDAAGYTRSDATGRFTLDNLPTGTQLLVARRIGFAAVQDAVELRAGRTTSHDVVLSRIVTLDSIQIIATRSRYQEFERRAGRASAAGSIFRAAQIERMNLFETGDIFRHVLGFRIVGVGADAKVRSSRGASSFRSTCDANIVIDGIQHQDVNLVPPGDIAGIEVYRGAAGAPIEYDSACGVVVIWTKR